MKNILFILAIFTVILVKANEPISNDEPTSIFVCINNKNYEISIDPERPYIVWISDTKYYESNDLHELIQHLYNLK